MSAVKLFFGFVYPDIYYIIVNCHVVVPLKAVKTGTGYSPKPTELNHVKLIKETVGDAVKIKVAGGVRNLETLYAFYKEGAQRFGIGKNAALLILDENGGL